MKQYSVKARFNQKDIVTDWIHDDLSGCECTEMYVHGRHHVVGFVGNVPTHVQYDPKDNWLLVLPVETYNFVEKCDWIDAVKKVCVPDSSENLIAKVKKFEQHDDLDGLVFYYYFKEV